METLSPSIVEQVSTILDRKLTELRSGNLYNSVEAATYLNCSTVQVWRLRRAGRLSFVKTGGKPLYEKRALDKVLNDKGAAL
jgi:excisionase family DNA binding protein